jgi:hypothetical protein
MARNNCIRKRALAAGESEDAFHCANYGRFPRLVASRGIVFTAQGGTATGDMSGKDSINNTVASEDYFAHIGDAKLWNNPATFRQLR